MQITPDNARNVPVGSDVWYAYMPSAEEPRFDPRVARYAVTPDSHPHAIGEIRQCSLRAASANPHGNDGAFFTEREETVAYMAFHGVLLNPLTDGTARTAKRVPPPVQSGFFDVAAA